jgi:hypothetical protein
MADDYTVRVHFIDGSERIVPARDIKHVGEEGARRAIALDAGREVPIYNRVEWGFLWYEQERHGDGGDPEQSPKKSLSRPFDVYLKTLDTLKQSGNCQKIKSEAPTISMQGGNVPRLKKMRKRLRATISNQLSNTYRSLTSRQKVRNNYAAE